MKLPPPPISRRSLLAGAAMTAGALSWAGPAGAGPRSPNPSGLRHLRSFTGLSLARINFPLGGVGAGCISLGGRGQLRDWEIFNRPDKGRTPPYAFAAINITSASQQFSAVLESPILPPYDGSEGLGFANVPGLPRFDEATFSASFPIAHIALRKRGAPVSVRIEAFSPFIPLDAERSGMPVAILRYMVTNRTSRPVRASVAFSLENPMGSEGRENNAVDDAGLYGVSMANPQAKRGTGEQGASLVLASLSTEAELSRSLRWLEIDFWRVGALRFWDEFTTTGSVSGNEGDTLPVATICASQVLAPGAETAFPFLLAWRVPTRTPQLMGWGAGKELREVDVGAHHATRYGHALDVARACVAELPSLESRTRAFVRAFISGNAPPVVLEAASANLSTLVSQTCFRTADGAFHAFEGTDEKQGLGQGTCTHVWNYETATAHLFPELSRSMRERSFGAALNEDGLMAYRQPLGPGWKHSGRGAADGQMGQVVKLFLDWRLGASDDWLRRIWPRAKKALEFAWVPGGWDADQDGVMEGAQHNTYDVEFFGPNPLCGVWYLAALRAGEAMAKGVGDNAAATRYANLAASGAAWIDRHLWNGRFYIQQVRGRPRAEIAPGLISGANADTEHPVAQMGEGCLIDQLVGQCLADVAGLGDLLDPNHIATALRSIYQMNFKPSLLRHHSVQRTYALGTEAGTIICAYDPGRRPTLPFPYFAEVMTGFEHALGALMIGRGMVQEGVQVVGAVRRRHDGLARNPWDEPEYGHHYARAMASWSSLVAWSGFRYDARDHVVYLRPASGGSIRSFWSSATGWGTFTYEPGIGRSKLRLSLLEGELVLARISLPPFGTTRTVLTLDGQPLPHEVEPAKAATVLNFAERTLRAGSKLAVSS